MPFAPKNPARTPRVLLVLSDEDLPSSWETALPQCLPTTSGASSAAEWCAQVNWLNTRSDRRGRRSRAAKISQRKSLLPFSSVCVFTDSDGHLEIMSQNVLNCTWKGKLKPMMHIYLESNVASEISWRNGTDFTLSPHNVVSHRPEFEVWPVSRVHGSKLGTFKEISLVAVNHQSLLRQHIRQIINRYSGFI